MAKKKQENLFEHLQQATGDLSGFEAINMNTQAIPFIRLLQPKSPVCDATDDAYDKNAKPGTFRNSVSGALYEVPLRIVVGRFQHVFLEFGANRGTFAGIHAPEAIIQANYPRAIKPNGKMGNLYNPQTTNEYIETYMYYVLLPDYMHEGVCIMSLSSTAIKEARRLNRMLINTLIPNTNSKAKPYFMVWNVNVTKEKNDQGSWFGYRFDLESFVTPDLLDNVTTEREGISNATVDYSRALPETTAPADEGEVEY